MATILHVGLIFTLLLILLMSLSHFFYWNQLPAAAWNECDDVMRDWTKSLKLYLAKKKGKTEKKKT